MRVVKTTEDFLIADTWNPGGEKLAHRVERYAYLDAPTEVLKTAVSKSRAAFASACYAASVIMRCELDAIAKGEGYSVVPPERLAKALMELAADAACRPLLQAGVFSKAEPAPNGVSDGDVHLDDERATTPWGRKRDRSITTPAPNSFEQKHGIEDVDGEPNLDEERNKATREAQPGEGVSKLADVLKAEGFEAGETDDEIEHYHHRDAGHEVMVHESGEFAIRNGWDGSIVTGEDVDDLQAALAEIA